MHGCVCIDRSIWVNPKLRTLGGRGGAICGSIFEDTLAEPEVTVYLFE